MCPLRLQEVRHPHQELPIWLAAEFTRSLWLGLTPACTRATSSNNNNHNINHPLSRLPLMGLDQRSVTPWKWKTKPWGMDLLLSLMVRGPSTVWAIYDVTPVTDLDWQQRMQTVEADGAKSSHYPRFPTVRPLLWACGQVLTCYSHSYLNIRANIPQQPYYHGNRA